MKTLLTMTVTADNDNPEHMKALLKISEAFHRVFLDDGGNYLASVPVHEPNTAVDA